ncbi:MAG: MGMT family protein [Sulfurovum sp.]|nr:MGMT family protein [Sulfurovum sp.]
MAKKTYQEQMHHSYPDYPIVKPIPASMVKSWGEGTQVLPSPIEIREVMRTIPKGKVMTTVELCDILAKKHKVDMACPYTTGILMNIVAKAIEEDETDDTPWWRTLGSKGEIKGSYPNAPEEQMALLEAEGVFFY